MRHCAAAIAACDRGGAWEMALKLLLRMDGRGVPPNTVAYNPNPNPNLSTNPNHNPSPNPNPSPSPNPKPNPGPNQVAYNSAISACARAAQWRTALALLDRMAPGLP